MLVLLRGGKISKWFSGMGQEGISVGASMALNADEYILPMHRNLEFLPLVEFLWRNCLSNFKEKRVVLPKDTIVRFTLGATNITL